VSREFGSDSGHGSPHTFGVMFGQVQLLLQLGIDGLAHETQAIELFLGLLSALCSLIDLSWGKQFQSTVLLQKRLQGGIIVGPISKEMFEMMGEGVQQFNHGLVVVAISWSKQEAHDDPAQAHNGVQLEPKVLHRLATTDAIVSLACKVAVGFAAFVAHAGHRGRVNHSGLFLL